ncbi:LysR family transcriptional regulator [Paenibacillus naphthalenovorans]
MDLRTIKTFQTIVKLGSFQRAAEELKYVQSTITMHIQKLESDLGVKLLERSKKVCLTEAGRLFHEKADLLLKDYEYLQSAMTEWIQGEAGVVRLGVMEPAASYRLPKILAPFMERYPKVQISIQIGNTYVLREMLIEGKIDLAICSVPDTGLGTTFEPLFAEKVALLVPKQDDLAGKHEIYLKDLRGKRLLLTTTICPYRKKLEAALLEKGGSPYFGIEISTMSALKYYVQANFGIAVVPIITVTPPPEGTVLKPIHDLDTGLVTGILLKSDYKALGSAGEKLISTLRDGLLNQKCDQITGV